MQPLPSRIGLGFIQYTQDADEKFPSGLDLQDFAGSSAAGSGWAGEIYPYIKSTGVYTCPDDSTATQTVNGVTLTPISYAMNIELSTVPLSQWTLPANSTILTEMTGSVVNVTDPHEQGDFMNCPASLPSSLPLTPWPKRGLWTALCCAAAGLLTLSVLSGPAVRAQSRIVPFPQKAAPWPVPAYRLNAHDGGVVMNYGGGPGGCDAGGARDVYVFVYKKKYYMTYDGAGSTGWLTCLAESRDGLHWNKKGAQLALGAPGQPDSASASYGVPFYDGKTWHMYYLATDKASPAPDHVPIGPYYTMAATAAAPEGPWTKHESFLALPKGSPDGSVNSSPGPVFRKSDGGYRMFFNSGVADTTDLDAPWTVVSKGIPGERCENEAIYYQPSDKTWFNFSDHIGDGYTDAVWVYWTHDPLHWESRNKAVVLDRTNCAWSKTIIGLPSVVQVGNKLAIYYDGSHDPKDTWHMKRDVGVAYLSLPIVLPK